MRTFFILLLAWGCASPTHEAPSEWAAVESSLAGDGVFERVADFGGNPGGLNMYRYVPPDAPANAPLVVAMHACSQDATAYRNAGWEPFADEFGFYVLYPEQTSFNNGLGCFNWAGEFGNGANLPRGDGENQSIKNMVDHMKANFDIDDSRVFATGHSGGGAQTALMLATWPDVFAGGATIAGVPYRCTDAFAEVNTCLSPGIPRAADIWGQYVRDAFPAFDGTYPKMSIWHGSADFSVSPNNATEMLKQWSNVHGADMQPDSSEMVDGHLHETYENAAGDVVVERYTIQGGDHATFVVPGMGCGSAAPFFSDHGICSTLRIAEFWGLTEVEPPPGDRVAPTVNLTAPADGSTVMDQVQLTADADDDVGVTEVEFFVNGNSVGTADGSPFQIMWDASAVPGGDYGIRVVARDAAGNEGVDDDTSVTVDSDVVDETAPTVTLTSPSDGSEVSGTISLSATAEDDVGVVRVVFLVDGEPVGESPSAPFSVQWDTAGGLGAHTIVARAEDAAGNMANASATVTVVDGPVMAAPPIITFTSPAEGDPVSGVVSFTTDASSADSPLTQAVLFWVTEDRGEVALGIDRAFPFEFLWDVRQVPAGSQRLIVRVFNQANGVGQDTLDVTVVEVTDVPDTPDVGSTPDANVRPEESEPASAGRLYPGCDIGFGDRDLVWPLLSLLLLFRRRRSTQESS